MRKFMAAICVTFLMVLQCAFFQVAVADDQYTAGSSDFLTGASDSNTGTPLFDIAASMPSTGTVNALALYVDFSDTDATAAELQAFQSILGPHTKGISDPAIVENPDNAPYQSVAQYYGDSSYGRVDIRVNVVSIKLHRVKADYATLEQALTEALVKADAAGVNFSDYDGNDDGKVDCIYLHFAGTEGAEKGSIWWSATGSLGGVPSYDGAEVWSFVSLNDASNTEAAAATAIHETGHAMGLPDYYSTQGNEHIDEDTGEMQGIGTFDMMFNSAGDHNGFSKWVLGWLNNSKITYVVANAKGITVKRGTEVTHAELVDGGYSVDVDLKSFVSEGEIAVVSTGDITSPYASYFILEYDRAAGNNAKVQFGQQSLPNGLRVFRVQAALDDEGGPVHTNNGTASGNRLIELVDPDGLDEHAVTTNGGYMKKGANQYGCMLFEGGKLGSTAPSDSSLQGASVEPTTPGTTLDGKGTGIGIEVKSISQDSSQSNQDSQCTVTISTQASSDPDPDPDPEPTPTPTPTTVTHKVIFKANGHGTSPTTQIVEHGKTATKPADPTADGYTFGGWYKDEACTQAYDFSTPVTADTALYAKWTQKSGAAAGAEEASKAATNKNQSSTKAASSTTSKNQTSSKAGTASSKTGDSPLVIGVVALVIVSGAAVVIAARRSRER